MENGKLDWEHFRLTRKKSDDISDKLIPQQRIPRPMFASTSCSMLPSGPRPLSGIASPRLRGEYTVSPVWSRARHSASRPPLARNRAVEDTKRLPAVESAVAA